MRGQHLRRPVEGQFAPLATTLRCNTTIGGNRWRGNAKVVALVGGGAIQRQYALINDTRVQPEDMVPYPHELPMQLKQGLA